MEGQPTNQRTPRAEGLAQTCRAILHCRTGHRGLQSTTEELVDSELSTSGSASLLKVKHRGIQFPYDLCVARQASAYCLSHVSSVFVLASQVVSVAPDSSSQLCCNAQLCATEPVLARRASLSKLSQLQARRPPAIALAFAVQLSPTVWLL